MNSKLLVMDDEILYFGNKRTPIYYREHNTGKLHHVKGSHLENELLEKYVDGEPDWSIPYEFKIDNRVCKQMMIELGIMESFFDGIKEGVLCVDDVPSCLDYNMLFIMNNKAYTVVVAQSLEGIVAIADYGIVADVENNEFTIYRKGVAKSTHQFTRDWATISMVHNKRIKQRLLEDRKPCKYFHVEKILKLMPTKLDGQVVDFKDEGIRFIAHSKKEYKSTIKHHRQIIDENGYFCGCGDFQMVRYSDTKRPCKHLQNVARLAKEYMFEQTINHWIS